MNRDTYICFPFRNKQDYQIPTLSCIDTHVAERHYRTMAVGPCLREVELDGERLFWAALCGCRKATGK